MVGDSSDGVVAVFARPDANGRVVERGDEDLSIADFVRYAPSA